MIQDLMLPITGSAGDTAALDAAIGLASSLGAHLSVIEPLHLPLPAPGPWGFTLASGLEEVHEKLRDQAKSNAAKLRARLDKEGISYEVRIAEAFVEPPVAVAPQARYSDLSVLTAPETDGYGAATVRGFFSALLLDSGRPVLVVPPRHPIELPIRHVVVAWQPTRESTRALHDAMPILTEATSVDVLVVDPVTSDTDHGADPGVDIATHLARHGLNVNVVRVPGGETVASTLLRHAGESNAQLLVAGGYGHSRLREWFLGGTTRELLDILQLPILFSH
jgi:nucleotide-binding universal stress UspA family protein